MLGFLLSRLTRLVLVRMTARTQTTWDDALVAKMGGPVTLGWTLALLYLRQHPQIWPDAVVVRFKELAASSLDIEIMAWFLTTDFGELQKIGQDILLGFMNVVERAGTGFAFPTRTVHLVQEQAPLPGLV
jgi:small-conductance mechanosensitive channel